MKRIRRMSVALGVGGGDAEEEDGKEESGSEDAFHPAATQPSHCFQTIVPSSEAVGAPRRLARTLPSVTLLAATSAEAGSSQRRYTAPA